MKYISAIGLGAVVIFWGSSVSAFQVHQENATHSLYTVSGLVEALITQGIISPDRVLQARTYAAVVERVHAVRSHDAHPTLSITASQLIEHSQLTFGRYEDIKGLVLLAKNDGEATVILTHPEHCPVTYRIYDSEDLMLYDSALRAACGEGATVRYTLAPGQVRMFEIEHRHRDQPLRSGSYRFLLYYGSYGSATRTVTIR